jgi:hypothetical protein
MISAAAPKKVARVPMAAATAPARECDRGRGERIADERNGAAEEQQAELALRERRQRPAHAVSF